MDDHRYLIDTIDAQEWASAFVAMHGGDEGLMVAWFANAIQTGRRSVWWVDAGDESLTGVEVDMTEVTTKPLDMPLAPIDEDEGADRD